MVYKACAGYVLNINYNWCFFIIHSKHLTSATYLGILYHFIAKISQKAAPKDGCMKGYVFINEIKRNKIYH